MEISFIGVPLKAGASRGGMEKGPAAIREAGLNEIFSYHQFHDEGDIPVNNEKEEGCPPAMKNLHHILDADSLLADKVVEVMQEGRFPIIFGGDHSLSWGSISGVKAVHDRFAVIYIDAHGDFNTAETSLTYNVHGMHMAYLMGFNAHDPLNDFYSKGIKLQRQDAYFIGTRSLDPGEKDFAHNFQLNICTTDDCRKLGAGKVAEETIRAIKESGVEHVHISLDIDCMDPLDVPGTGVPEPKGIHPEFVYELLSVLLKQLPVCSLDLVEFDPEMDIDNRSLNVCKHLLKIVADNVEPIVIGA